jgi:hypothetical protein
MTIFLLLGGLSQPSEAVSAIFTLRDARDGPYESGTPPSNNCLSTYYCEHCQCPEQTARKDLSILRYARDRSQLLNTDLCDRVSALQGGNMVQYSYREQASFVRTVAQAVLLEENGPERLD